LGTTSQQQGGRSKETESKHDERNALDEQKYWRRNTPDSDRILPNRNQLQVIQFGEVTWGVPYRNNNEPKVSEFCGPKK
jgi:hypothetical protein